MCAVATTVSGHRWSKEWLNSLRHLGLLPTAGTGTSSNSRIKRMEVILGALQAEVQDRTRGPCSVTVVFAPLAAAAWTRLQEIVEQHTQGTPQIAPQNAFPQSGPAFSELSALLLPQHTAELDPRCSCCAPADRNCPALQAVYRQLGAMLDEEPMLLLRLRGREWQQLVQALQARRSAGYSTGSTARKTGNLTPNQESRTDPTSADDKLALEAQLDNFWGSRKEMESFRHYIALPTIDLALLRRLGPLPEALDDPASDRILALLYRKVTERAAALAYAPDVSNGVEEPGDGPREVPGEVPGRNTVK